MASVCRDKPRRLWHVLEMQVSCLRRFFARELAAEDEHGETGVVGGAEMRLSHLRTPRLLCSSSSAEVTNSTLAVLHDDHDHLYF